MPKDIYGCDGLYPIEMQDFFPPGPAAQPSISDFYPDGFDFSTKPKNVVDKKYYLSKLPPDLLLAAKGIIADIDHGLSGQQKILAALLYFGNLLHEFHPETAKEIGLFNLGADRSSTGRENG